MHLWQHSLPQGFEAVRAVSLCGRIRPDLEVSPPQRPARIHLKKEALPKKIGSLRRLPQLHLLSEFPEAL